MYVLLINLYFTKMPVAYDAPPPKIAKGARKHIFRSSVLFHRGLLISH